jgi:hypothetical protein
MDRIIGIHGCQGFIGFFQQVGTQGLVILLTVPRAAIRSTQVSDDLLEGFE